MVFVITGVLKSEVNTQRLPVVVVRLWLLRRSKFEGKLDISLSSFISFYLRHTLVQLFKPSYYLVSSVVWHVVGSYATLTCFLESIWDNDLTVSFVFPGRLFPSVASAFCTMAHLPYPCSFFGLSGIVSNFLQLVLPSWTTRHLYTGPFNHGAKAWLTTSLV